MKPTTLISFKSRRGIIRNRGAVLVEAAMATIFIVLPLLLGIIQFGLYYSALNTMTHASREGARWAAVYALRTDLRTPGVPDKFIKDHIIDRAGRASVNLTYNDITISPGENDPDRAQYKPISVTIKYDMKSKVLLPLYNPGEVTRSASAMVE